MSEREHAAVLRRSLKQALRRRDLDDAEALHARLAEVAPGDLEAQLLAVELRLLQRRLPEARALADASVQRAPDHAWAHELLGHVALQQKQAAVGLRAFEAAERLAPSPRTRLWVARAHLRLDDLDAAEPILRSLGAPARMDLAWVHERRKQPELARKLVEQHLAEHPDDAWAQAARQRLVAATLGREEVLEEVEAMRALGEPLAAPLVRAALEHTLAMGRTADARALLEPHLAGMTTRQAVDWGWVAYRAVALDLAYDLFSRAVGANTTNAAFLNALQRAARDSGRAAALADLLEAHTAQTPALWGRIRKLRASP